MTEGTSTPEDSDSGRLIEPGTPLFLGELEAKEVGGDGELSE